MAEFYVDGATGDDRAPGTSAQPLLTISRATELAAEALDGSGTIHVSPGTYDLSHGENFPILVPPGYALVGTSSSGLPVIRFEAQAREPGGRIVPFWDSVVMIAGAGLRNVVLEADPAEDAPPCSGMVAVGAREDGVAIVNVEFRARSLDVEDGFAVGIGGLGNRGVVRGTRFRPGGGGVFWTGGACTLTQSSFNGAWASFGPGAHYIAAISFENATLHLGSNTDARAQYNTFHGVSHGAAIFIEGWRLRGTSADGPFIDDNVIRDCLVGITCEGPGTATFRRNTIEGNSCGVWVRLGAEPIFESGNVIWKPTDAFAFLLRTELGAFPAFEETLFDSYLASPSGAYVAAGTALLLSSPVDFGGGGRSRGTNSFGSVYSSPVADIPGGGVITAHDNLWPYVGGRLFEAAPGTVVEYDGARVDPHGWTRRRP